MIPIIVEISARHVHLSKADLEKLFGTGYQLHPIKNLSQKGQFASEETVTLKHDGVAIAGVRVLGPCRWQTQVEISKTDARRLKILPPVRESGDLENSERLTLVGPRDELTLASGVIIAKRHIHASPADASQYQLKDGQHVSVRIGGERSLTFGEVVVRVREDFVWALHLDVDEGNAAGSNTGDQAEVII